MDAICDLLQKVVDKVKRYSRIDRCISDIDPITKEKYQIDDDVIYIIMPTDSGLITSAQCCLRTSLINTFKYSNKVYQWTRSTSTACCPDEDYRVYKDPVMGIWYVHLAYNRILNDSKDRYVYVAVAIDKHTIGSEFTPSSMHGTEVTLYYLWRICDDIMEKWQEETLTMEDIQDRIEKLQIPQRAKTLLRPYDDIQT